jgi:hypothetical protein
MVGVDFTPNLARHLTCVTVQVPGGTLRTVLEHTCGINPKLRGYLLDDQGRLRRHVTVFKDYCRNAVTISCIAMGSMLMKPALVSSSARPPAIFGYRSR